MRMLRLLAVLLVLAGCKGSGLTSTVDGVYDGVTMVQSFNGFPPPPPSRLPFAGAVAPDGNGYFAYTGLSSGSLLIHFTNLWQPGPERLSFSSDPNSPLVPVIVNPVANGGYKFFTKESNIDVDFTEIYTSNAVTNQPRRMTELAGSYQGSDIFESQPSQVTGTLDATGKLAANGDGCDIAVQLSQVADKNLYTVTVQFSDGPGCDVPLMSGVAWVGDSDLSGISPNKGIYLNIIASDERFDTALMLRLL